MRTEKILIGEILMNNDRADGGQGDIESLARNMDKYGQINAVTVVEDISASYRYRIIAGRRRIAAAESLGWADIRADIYGADEIGEGSEEMIALSENAAREEMNAIDEGVLYAKELKKGTSVEELAALFCRNKSTVYQRAKLAALVPEMRSLYKAGKMSLHVAAMASVLPEEAQKDIAEKAGAGWVSEWDIKRAVQNAHDDFLSGIAAYCAECATCQKRTRYSDKSLFPELADSDDRCLDHGCYCKKIGSRIEAAFSEWGERMKETPELDAWDGKRIVTTVSVPDGITVLGIALAELDEDTEADIFGDLGEFELTEECIAQLEGDGKTEICPCWDGEEFHTAKLVKIADIDALFDDGEEKEDTAKEDEWTKKWRGKIDDICRALDEHEREEIFSMKGQWYQVENKLTEIFNEKMRQAVALDDDIEKPATVADKAAIALMLSSKSEEFRDYLPEAEITEADGERTLAVFEKVRSQKLNDILRALLRVLLSGYRTKPEIRGLDESDWSKIFAYLGIDLAALRDEAAKEFFNGVSEKHHSETTEKETVPDADSAAEADGVVVPDESDAARMRGNIEKTGHIAVNCPPAPTWEDERESIKELVSAYGKFEEAHRNDSFFLNRPREDTPDFIVCDVSEIPRALIKDNNIHIGGRDFVVIDIGTVELTPRAYPAYGDKLLYKDGKFSITWTVPKPDAHTEASGAETETQSESDGGLDGQPPDHGDDGDDYDEPTGDEDGYEHDPMFYEED